ncbi:MAG TPA: hypothetical protein VFR44_01795 [Actinomycetota bacterium]|nr:hypothetical protein [Actinomycetota bacterium]
MEESALLFTQQMRTSDDPSWIRLREHLAELQIHAGRAAIGDRSSESQGDFGVLVTDDGRAFVFLFRPGDRGDIRMQIRETTITDRRELRSGEERFPYAHEIAVASEVLRDERHRPGLNFWSDRGPVAAYPLERSCSSS